MTFQEKALYHQVHPIKLATDTIAQIVSLFFFWQHNLILGLAIMLIPPMIASLILMNSVDLTRIKDSAVGAYLRRAMPRSMEMVRLFGTLPVVFGAWYHNIVLIVIGLLIVALGWTLGAFIRTPGNAA